ncbi:hypothetical protein EBR56_07000 [bacterium]|nr:hypothetical protein [bacterium]
MRPAAAAWYGIGPEHVIASRSTSRMEEVEPAASPPPGASPNRRLALVIQPQLEVLNDEGRKPVSIGEQIGRRPIFAAGNVGTGGDVEMLRWSQSGDRPNLQLLVLHDDADREMAYGEPTNESLDAAAKYGWQVVRMATDWKRVFAQPLEKRPAAAGSKAAPAPGGICLVGSSNISLWSTLARDFSGMNVVNCGVAGARLAELADVAPKQVAAVMPRAVVVSAGGNDLAAGATPAEVRDAFAKLVANLQSATPDATIAFLAIAPSIKRWEQREPQAAANEAVRAFIEAAADPRLRYLDANAAFIGSDGTPDPVAFVDDQQHPSTIGNARRAEILLPAFKEMLE